MSRRRDGKRGDQASCPVVKIALSGAHGVGKSTLAGWLANELELPVLPTPGRWMAARGLPVNEDASVASQTLAWLLQHRFEAEVDRWIAPRSLVDVWAYTALAAERESEPLTDSTFEVLTYLTERTVRNRYTALLYLPPRHPLRPDAVRSGDERFQRQVDAAIRERLEVWELPHLVLDVTQGDARDEALRYVQERYAKVTAGGDGT